MEDYQNPLLEAKEELGEEEADIKKMFSGLKVPLPCHVHLCRHFLKFSFSQRSI